MSIKIEKFSTCNKNLFDLACQIRTKVFVEEQKVPIEIEYEFEDEAVHYILFFDGKPAGTGRYRSINGAYKLERFAVYRKYRGKGVGEGLLLKILDETKHKGKEIYLNAQVSAVDFYKKYGFVKTGEPFYEANIEHYKMIYKPE